MTYEAFLFTLAMALIWLPALLLMAFLISRCVDYMVDKDSRDFP